MGNNVSKVTPVNDQIKTSNSVSELLENKMLQMSDEQLREFRNLVGNNTDVGMTAAQILSNGGFWYKKLLQRYPSFPRINIQYAINSGDNMRMLYVLLKKQDAGALDQYDRANFTHTLNAIGIGTIIQWVQDYRQQQDDANAAYR